MKLKDIMTDTLSSRKASVQILRDIIMHALPMDQLEEKYLEALDPRERRLARAITVTTLRHIGEISHLIDQFMEHPFDHDSIEKNIMRTGVAQLLYIESIPSHAAIHGSVELAKQLGKPRATGIINAILRRTQREAKNHFANDKRYTKNIPKWMQERLTKDYGEEKAHSIMSNMLRGAKIDLRLRNGFRPVDEETIYNIPLHEEAYRIKDRAIAPVTLDGWDDGHIYVQDVMSQTPAHFIKGFGTGHKILDMCAAPGGKTLQLIDYNPGAEITAADINGNRITRIHENLTRCRVHAEVCQCDGTEPNFADGTFDAILLDAPCSATGTTRRNPDVLVTRRKADVRALLALQETMLARAADALKVGGTLVYSTCSLLKQEGELQIATFLEKNPNFSIQKADTSIVNDPELITEEGFVRSSPDRNLDGFFVACLLKNE